MSVTLAMACGILAIGFGYLFLVTFYPIPETGVDHAKVIVGFMLGSVIGVIVGYFWGSSSGSADKSKVIENIVDKKGEQTNG